MWFNVNYTLLIIHLLPTFLRKIKLFLFLQIMTTPLQNVRDLWAQKRTENDWYKINHTGQVCRLRKALNDTLDVDGRRIWIGDGDSFPRKYIYTRAEQRPKFLSTYYIYSALELETTGADFVVHTPQEIIDNSIHELQAIINFYKLAGMRYQIRPL